METCFVIQPFDKGKFDKRFDDVFSPAIEAAGLKPYRVDRDPGVEVPIDSIEQGIRDAALCLVDITTDNPNVWYELGFAYAAGRPVVMVCAKDRTAKFPFDVQHRTIIHYDVDSSSDFNELKSRITKRIKALLTKSERLRVIESAEQVAPAGGLSAQELAILASVAGGTLLPGDAVVAYSVRNDVEKAGFTPIGIALGIQRLLAKKFIVIGEFEDAEREQPYNGIQITPKGWLWIEKNEDKFITHRKPNKAKPDDSGDPPF